MHSNAAAVGVSRVKTAIIHSLLAAFCWKFAVPLSATTDLSSRYVTSS